MSIARRRLSACVLMAPGWTLRQCVEGWQRAGLAAIGLTRHAVRRAGVDEARALLADSGLAIANLQNLDPFDVLQPARFDELLARTLRRLDVAAALGADCVYTCTGGRGHLDWHTAADRLVAQARRLLPHLHERGLRLAIEPVHPLRQDLSFLNTAADTIEVTERVGDPAIGLVHDFWHLWWEREAVPAARRAAGHVVSVQPSDHKPVTLRTMDRAVIGDGLVPVGPLVGALESGGYRGFYDLEVLSEDNDARGYDRTLADTIAGFADAVGGLDDGPGPAGA